MGADLLSVFKVLWLYHDPCPEEVKAMYTSQLGHISQANRFVKGLEERLHKHNSDLVS